MASENPSMILSPRHFVARTFDLNDPPAYERRRGPGRRPPERRLPSTCIWQVTDVGIWG